MDPGAAVLAATEDVSLGNPEREQAVRLRARARRPLAPCVEARTRDLQRPAQLAHLSCRRCRGVLRFDERELHAFSLAKNAAAFFRMSLSTRRTRFSFRSRANSSFSSVVSVPRLLFPPSARACSTHFPSDDGVRSRSFDT